MIGPSNSGKTTFLRMLNRLNDLQPNFRMSGTVEFEGENIRRMDVERLRRKVGMVFALPLPLPLSIFDNVAYGPRMHGLHNRNKLSERVEEALRSAYLWDEVKDRLHESAFKLSGGQQQRLCIARTLAVEPRGDSLRRALLGARSDLDREGGRRHGQAQAAVYPDPGDEQRETGGAGRRQDGVLPERRADRDRQDRQDLHGAGGQPHRRLYHGEGSDDEQDYSRKTSISGMALSTP